MLKNMCGLELKKEARRKPIFKKILKRLLPRGKAKEFNWAIIDLASLICIPRTPVCLECPLKEICQYARSSGLKASFGRNDTAQE